MQPVSILNNDCLFHIFSFFNHKQLNLVSRVCKSWHELASSSGLWKDLYIRKYESDEKTEDTHWKHLFIERKKNDNVPHPMEQFGAWLMTGLPNGNISIYYRLRQKKQSIGILKGHQDRITYLTISGFDLVSSSKDKTIRIWDFTKRECLAILEGHDAAVNVLLVASINQVNYLFSGAEDGTIRQWSCKLHFEKYIKTLSQDSTPVTCLINLYFSPLIVSGYQDGSVRVTDPITNHTSVYEGHTRKISCLKKIFYKDQFLSGSYDGTIRLWNTSSARCLKVLQSDSSPINDMIVANSDQFFTSSVNRTIQLWHNSKSQIIYQGKKRLSIKEFLPDSPFPLIIGYEGNLIFLLTYGKYDNDSVPKWKKFHALSSHKKALINMIAKKSLFDNRLELVCYSKDALLHWGNIFLYKSTSEPKPKE